MYVTDIFTLFSGKTCTEFSYDLFVRTEPKFLKPKSIPTATSKGKLNGRKRIAGNGIRNKSKTNVKQ